MARLMESVSSGGKTAQKLQQNSALVNKPLEQQKYTASLCLANFSVIAFLPLLFFIVTLLGYLGLLSLEIPTHGIGILAVILIAFLFMVRHNANYSICKIRNSYLKMDIALHQELDRTALQYKTTRKSLLDINSFLEEYYSDVRDQNFASVASSIFPMLGILGTFSSIALSMPNFSVSQSAALDHEISLLLNGVGSAFYASIYGIFLSLVWTYFEKRGLSKIDAYFNELKKEYRDNLWPKEDLLRFQYAYYIQSTQE